MLIEFSAGNFRSLLEPVTLSLVATTLDRKNIPLAARNVIPAGKDLSLLRSAVIYGANASGKSNLFKAFGFFRHFVLNSARESTAEDRIPTEPFLLRDDTRPQPSHFEIVFLADGIQYRYGFEATTERVTAEWLYYTPKSREATLFVRDGQTIHIPSHSAFREGRGLAERTRPNALFLSVSAQFNGSVASRVLKMLGECGLISASIDRGYLGYTIRCIETGKYRSQMDDLMHNLGLDIEGLSVVEEPIPTEILQVLQQSIEGFKDESGVLPVTSNMKRIQTRHTIRDEAGDRLRSEDFDLDEMESEGTQKIIALCGPLFDALTQGRVLLVDEIDARLHPLLTAAILRLFNSPETNPNGAQLICATHDTNLLDGRRLRRDQIYFTEKENGATRLYSLADFRLDGKRVRSDASFEEDYIRGRYGAIPYLGDLRRLFTEIAPEGMTGFDAETKVGTVIGSAPRNGKQQPAETAYR